MAAGRRTRSIWAVQRDSARALLEIYLMFFFVLNNENESNMELLRWSSFIKKEN